MDSRKYAFLSVYKKDYVKKPIKIERAGALKQEFSDPVNEGFRNYLSLDEAKISSPKEDGELYLEKFKENYKTVGRIYFKDPLDKEIISRNKRTRGTITEYQTNYCDLEKDVQDSERRTQKQILSDDAQIPLTTYTALHGNPYRVPGDHKPLIIIPPDNLRTSGVAMPEALSDYSTHIGRLGGLIVESMHERHRTAKSKKI